MRCGRLGILVTVVAAFIAVVVGVMPSAQATPPAGVASGYGGSGYGPSWQLVNTGSTEHFRGLAVVNRNIVWLGGYDGTVLRTVDGGRTWSNVSPAGAGTLQFRDIAATDDRHAVAMAAGEGSDSRLYVTDNGGASWRLAYQNTNAAAFFDCMSFADAAHGLVMSDPVGGKFRILRTDDGGQSWHVLPNAGMPAALTGEAGFAASGECLTTSGFNAWFGTGGASTSRVFSSRDFGLTWSATTTPIPSSASSGVNGLAFRTPFLGVAVGGDFDAPDANTNVAATSLFFSPWRSAATQPGGYRSGVTFVPATLATVVAVGLTGSDVSYDGGRDWRTFDTGSFDTVVCATDGTCWASGADGRVGVLRR